MERVVVVGGGTMGAGIAFVAARAGYAVDLIEPDNAARDRARARILKDAERAKAAGAAERVDYYAELQPGMQAGLAIEAVPERLDLKRTIFQNLARTLGPDALLATNTSSLAVAQIGEGIAGPERILGLHFFNPPSLMQLVEIVRTDQTSEEAVDSARQFVERIGKKSVLTADTPGFIVNRVARPFYLQAMHAYQDGVAPMEDLDRLARGIGFRMGPFELMDLIGIDVNLATSDSVFERTQADRLEPVLLQRQMVAKNRLGRKTGAGFYDYAQGPPQRDDALPGPPPERNRDEKIVVVGYAGVALELTERLRAAYDHVELWENEESLEEIEVDTTIVFDVGDGASDRTGILERLDSLLPQETVIFADAYATDLQATAKRLEFPQRLTGYGVLCTLEEQRVVEIVDSENVSDDALELAQEVFESIERRVALVEDRPGLFLGRTVCSIVNEAMYVVEDRIATADDVDLAMQLGTNYPKGPIAWGKEIGADRIRRILQRLARSEGSAFAPHRALWLLDVQDEEELQQPESSTGSIISG